MKNRKITIHWQCIKILTISLEDFSNSNHQKLCFILIHWLNPMNVKYGGDFDFI